MAAAIPLRPSGKKFKLSEDEMNCLTWYYISGCTQEQAYTTFLAPDMKGSRAAKQYTQQFFSMAEARDYLSAYSSTMIRSRGGAQEKEPTPEQREKRTNVAIKKFTDKVVGELETVETLEEMESAAKLADKLGILEDNTGVQEAPRRYLPMMCFECPHKLFIDEQINLGNIILQQ